MVLFIEITSFLWSFSILIVSSLTSEEKTVDGISYVGNFAKEMESNRRVTTDRN
jgi:hypothetical protein